MNNKAEIITLGGNSYITVDIHDEKEAPAIWNTFLGYAATWTVRLSDTVVVDLSDFRAIHGSGHVILIARITATSGNQRDAERMVKQHEKIPFQVIIGSDLATSGVIYWPFFRAYNKVETNNDIYKTAVGTIQFVIDRVNAT